MPVATGLADNNVANALTLEQTISAVARETRLLMVNTWGAGVKPSHEQINSDKGRGIRRYTVDVRLCIG